MTSTELLKKHNELVAAVRACLHVARTGNTFLERTEEFEKLKALNPKKVGSVGEGKGGAGEVELD